VRSEFRFRFLAACVALVLVVLTLDGAVHLLMAQTPFGGPRPSGAEAPPSGLVGWLLAKQSEFYRQMSSTIRAAKSDGSAVWTLLAISFAYGIFHAAGPGHGKAVISSYLVANQETARRGIVLSFASALMQSLVAVAIVGICALLLNATAKTMCGAERVIEIASYALIAAGWSGPRAADSSARCGRRNWCRRWRLHIIMTITIMATTTTITAMFMPVWRMMITGIATTLTGIIRAMAMSTTSIAATPMVPTPVSLPVPAAGGAGLARSSPSASGPAPVRSWFWCSRWRKGCSGPGSRRPS